MRLSDQERQKKTAKINRKKSKSNYFNWETKKKMKYNILQIKLQFFITKKILFFAMKIKLDKIIKVILVSSINSSEPSVKM